MDTNDSGVKDANIKKSKKTVAVVIGLVVVLVVLFFSYIQPKVIKPMKEYNTAVELLNKGQILKAEEIFKSLGDYKDSAQQVDNCEVAKGDKYLNTENYEAALRVYNRYKDNPNVTEEKITACKKGLYDNAIELYNTKQYISAKTLFEQISDYSDSKTYIEKCNKGIEEAEKKAKKEAETAAKEAEEKKAAEEEQKAAEEQKKREKSGIIGTWYAKMIVNYIGNDMTDQMGDLSYYYITFNTDGTGIFSAGEDRGNAAWGGKHDFTWKIENTGAGNGSIGTWTMNGDTDDIYLYDDKLVISTEKMDSIAYAMKFFCYR